MAAVLEISADVGDSLSEGTELSCSLAMLGLGNWQELGCNYLAKVGGLALISPGARGVHKTTAAESTGEWTNTAGSHTAPTTSDLYDVGLGGIGSTGYGFWTVGGKMKWTKPAYMSNTVGFQVTAVDINRLTGANGGQWRLSIDGGSFVQHGQTIAHDNAIFDFYVASPVQQSVEFYGNDGSADVAMFILSITPFYVDPRATSTYGYMHHNLAVNGCLLHDQVASGTAGNRLAWFLPHKVDAVNGGGAIDLRPNLFMLLEWWRDVTLASVSTYDTDLKTWNTAVSALGKQLWIAPYELAQYPDESNSVSPGFPWADQASYRTQIATTAAGLGIPLLSWFDRYKAMGYGDTNAQNLALRAAGLVNPLDNGHETQAGHFDLAQPTYWFIRNNVAGFGNQQSAWKVGGSGVGAGYGLTGYSAFTSGITDSDASTLTESDTLSVAVSVADAATAGDTGRVTAAAQATDGAVLGEAAASVATVTGADGGTVVETPGVAAGLTASDAATLTESAAAPLGMYAVSDGATMAEHAGVAATIIDTDGFSLVEAGALAAQLVAVDGFTLAEAVAVAVVVSATDAAAFADAATLFARITDSDTATADDESSVTESGGGASKFANDDFVLTEQAVVQVAIVATDAIGLSDQAAIAAALHDADTASVVDVAMLAAAINPTDGFTVTDQALGIVARIAASEGLTLVEQAAVAAVLSDTDVFTVDEDGVVTVPHRVVYGRGTTTNRPTTMTTTSAGLPGTGSV